MKNFVNKGDTLRFTAEKDIKSGEPVKIGELSGVSTVNIKNGGEGVAAMRGVFNLIKKDPKEEIKAGNQVYIDSGKIYATKSEKSIPFGHAAYYSAASAEKVEVMLR